MCSLRILVVEDQHDLADIFALLLRMSGHEAVVAHDGPNALHAASANQPDAVLLDIDLPGMDGYELARQLRRLPGMAKALLIAVTGYGQEADVRQCKEAGIHHHFLKPVDPQQLQEVLMKTEARPLSCLM